VNDCPNCAALRRLLAQMTAQYVWVEGGSYARINRELEPLGYRLAPDPVSGRIPRIEPIQAAIDRR
jgi:hypothetical protein